jgi:rhodanese-related sulfurtransferase
MMRERLQGGSENPAPSGRMTRRAFGLAGVAAIGGGAVLAARWYNITARAGAEGTLSTEEAHKAAVAGDVILIDIRRPDEWASTGVGEGAIPLDMRRKDFTDALLLHTAGRTDVPVALICARGVRSRNLTNKLTDAGFTTILNVPEGMLGSGAGPGWIKRDLPLVAWAE